MAAPIFDDDEVAWLMRCQKYLSSSALQERFRVTDGGGEHRRLLLTLGTDPLPRHVVKLAIAFDECVNGKREEVSIALLATIDQRGAKCFCHYDIQANAHKNPPWSDGRYFRPFAPHRHVYKPQNVSRGDLKGLMVAEPITIRGLKLFASRADALFRIACRDLNIAVDRDYQLGLQWHA